MKIDTNFILPRNKPTTLLALDYFCCVSVYSFIQDKSQKGEKILAVLIDPDKSDADKLQQLVQLCNNADVDLIFIGGSKVLKSDMDRVVGFLKMNSKVPVVIFPGHSNQLSEEAHALLFLSLISGRNPEYLIEQQIKSVDFLRQSSIEVISTGYVLIDGGNRSSVSMTSETMPIPAEDIKLIRDTALAGSLLGHQLIYLEAGSGAVNPISQLTIESVSSEIKKPLIVGGGIRSSAQAVKSAIAGADVIVIGNVLEKEPSLVTEISSALHKIKQGQQCL